MLGSAASAQPDDGASTAANGGYDLSWWTVDGGGVTFSTGGGYTLASTCGQADAGDLSGGPYTLAGGFWRGAVPWYRITLLLVYRNAQHPGSP